MVFILIGIAFLIFTFYTLWKRRKREEKLAEMLASESAEISYLQKILANEDKKEHHVEIIGKAQCDAPITSPFSLSTVVFYKATIKQFYKTKETFINQNGQEQEKWVSKESVVFDEEDFSEFYLEDKNGRVFINPEGAEITPKVGYESEESIPVFEVSERFNDHPKIKKKFDNLVSELRENVKDRDVQGYHFIEYILPLNQNLFVQGMLFQQKGSPVLTNGENKRLLLSVKSANQTYQGIESKIQQMFFTAIVSGLIGLILVFYGIKTML